MGTKKNTNNSQSQTQAQAQTAVATINQLGFDGSRFEHDSLIGKYGVEKIVPDDSNIGVEVFRYEMTLKGIGETPDLLLSDEKAIEALEGIRLADKLEKYVAYRKGAYLVQLVDSSFMKNNEVKSIAELAKHYEIGVETSTCNALENVSRKLGVSFDSDGNMSFSDSELPILSFWHYSQIISLVRESENGGYDYSNLKEFLRLAQVTPLMSQKRLKELFNDYRNKRLDGQILALPQNILDGVKRAQEAADRKQKEKEAADNASKVVSGKIALEKAEKFVDKQAVAISAVDTLVECLQAIGVELDGESIANLLELINKAEPPKATPTEGGKKAADNQ